MNDAKTARLLVTGFEPFPGAPVNPTERLVARLRAEPPAGEGISAFRAEVLPVDYGAVGPRLSAIGREFSPDIALHFGLATECSGFRLERIARNRFDADRPDNSGILRAGGAVCAGPDIIASRLPLDAIASGLSVAGLPVEWSDDAGGYLCNTVMTLSLNHACAGFTPAMSGFVHVPLTGPRPAHPMTEDELVEGARIAIGACVGHWAGAATA